MHKRDAVAEAREAASGEAKRLRVAIKADQAGVRATVEDSLAVPAHPESRVDVDAAGSLERGREELDTALEEHRRVKRGGVAFAAALWPSCLTVFCHAMSGFLPDH